MSSKAWIRMVLIGTLLILGICAALTAYIDPFFHYHAPLENFQYLLNDERYQNDGIVRHFKYNAIITGTSMCENFKTSEMDELWGTNSIKVPFAGGSNKEISINLKKALKANSDVTMVLHSLDYSSLSDDKDELNEGLFERPEYLYDLNVFNDAPYLLNKEVLLERVYDVIGYTRNGGVTTTFDAYMNWNNAYDYGEEAILEIYERPKKANEEEEMTEDKKQRMLDNINQNIVNVANEYPEVTFYIFFPPYGICYWDELQQRGRINERIDLEQCAIEALLACPNIKLYSFCTNYDMVCNLDNYKDQAHYGEWINSAILKWMYNDEYRLTKENYVDYIDSIRQFYSSYDYSRFE